MKNTGKITLCGIMASLAVVFMLTSYFPYLTYAIPAISGLFIMVLVIELSKKWAFAAYVASAVLVFLFAEMEAKLVYVFFCGYYPILKSVLEKTKHRALEYILKFLCFNGAVFIIYGAFSGMLGITMQNYTDFGIYGLCVLLLGANFVFLLYDLAVSKMAAFYIYKFSPLVSKYIKK